MKLYVDYILPPINTNEKTRLYRKYLSMTQFFNMQSETQNFFLYDGNIFRDINRDKYFIRGDFDAFRKCA